MYFSCEWALLGAEAKSWSSHIRPALRIMQIPFRWKIRDMPWNKMSVKQGNDEGSGGKDPRRMTPITLIRHQRVG
jgi:hypothetical protein